DGGDNGAEGDETLFAVGSLANSREARIDHLIPPATPPRGPSVLWAGVLLPFCGLLPRVLALRGKDFAVPCVDLNLVNSRDARNAQVEGPDEAAALDFVCRADDGKDVGVLERAERRPQGCRLGDPGHRS